LEFDIRRRRIAKRRDSIFSYAPVTRTHAVGECVELEVKKVDMLKKKGINEQIEAIL
jgi:hypothetical protein